MARGKKKETLTLEERLQAALVPESEQPYKVPGNWCWTFLKPISKIRTGKKDANYGSVDGEYPFFTCAAEPIRCHGYSFDCNAILLAGNGDINNISRYNGKFEAYQRTYVVEIIEPINIDYVFYWFKYRWFDFNKDKMFGTAIPYIRLGNLQEFPIPLPPLPEQQRIVDRIESLFAKLDEAKQKAQDALDSFESRKAAILHKAFTGELTAQWRKEHGVGIETWSSCKLIDILVEKPRNGYSPKPVDYVTACKSMTLSATTTGVFKPEFFKYIDEEIPEDSHLWLTPGDILIQRANSLEKVGMSAIYTGAEYEFIYPDLMMKLTVKEPNNKHYIDYYLKTDEILNYFRSNATGTAGNMPKINQKVVSETPLILPETQEQAEIVRLLDDLLAKEQQAKEAAERVLEQIDLIKKAILARAFRGELGTNDPSEESVMELLKVIM